MGADVIFQRSVFSMSIFGANVPSLIIELLTDQSHNEMFLTSSVTWSGLLAVKHGFKMTIKNPFAKQFVREKERACSTPDESVGCTGNCKLLVFMSPVDIPKK